MDFFNEYSIKRDLKSETRFKNKDLSLFKVEYMVENSVLKCLISLLLNLSFLNKLYFIRGIEKTGDEDVILVLYSWKQRMGYFWAFHLLKSYTKRFFENIVEFLLSYDAVLMTMGSNRTLEIKFTDTRKSIIC